MQQKIKIFHDMLVDSLTSIIHSTLPTVIMGDFNIDPKRDVKEYNKLVSALATKGLAQVVTRATHMRGYTLDHIYIRGINHFEWQLHHPYWTDHDATCLQSEL